MDVQMENNDPPPCESQPSGKIRKGFKLFGKRKPGNIFSIRSKGDGNSKSPSARSKTLDGLTETTAPDSEQEPEKEKEQEVRQGESGQAEEEPLGEDGVLAATPPRASISSATSAKSLSFLSLLRGGQRGGVDRRVQTVSQPVGRQRRGLKGLFGNVKFRQKDKDGKEEAPPSPLLMSSRTNSVEIIKEDLTLTPKSQPRSLDSPETESCEPVMSVTTPDSSATSPSETIAPQMTAGNVSRTNEHVPPLPTTVPPMEPGETSLSCLLADISSLLTFDSISGGGDIIADVEAEWGKASSAISAIGTEEKPSSATLSSKPVLSSSLTSTPSISSTATAKPSPLAVHTTASTQSFTPKTKPMPMTSYPISQPRSITTISTKPSTLTTHSVKSGSDLTPATEPTTIITIKSTPTPTATTKPLTSPITLTSFSAPLRSSPPMTMKSTPCSTSNITTAPPIPPATVDKTPSISATLTSTAGESAPETTAITQIIAPVSKPSPVSSPPPASAKPTPVTHSPPTPVASTHPPSAKLDSTNVSNMQTTSSHKPFQSSAAAESKAPMAVSPVCTVPPQLSSPAPVVSSKMPTVPTSTPAPGSLFVTISDPTHPPGPSALNKTPPSLVTITDPVPTPTPAPIPSTKPQPSPAPVPTPIPVSLNKIPPTATPTPPVPTPIPVSLNKIPPTATPTPPVPTTPTPPAPTTPTPPVLTPIPLSLNKIPPTATPTPAPVSVDKMTPPAPTSHAAVPVPVPTPTPTPTPPAPALMPMSLSKTPPASAPVLCPVSSPAPTPAPLLGEAPTSAKVKGSGQASVDGQLASPSSTDTHGAQTISPKTEEPQNESRTTLQGPTRDRRTPPAKASGLSKIPVVGGGRAGKLPVRDNQHVDDEGSWDPPTPVLEERPQINLQDGGSKDKISDAEASVPTTKHTQEESQQPHQPKVITSLPRDSKIPVKQGAQSHTASQIPQAKEPPRTKIPVSKVPVRRIGNKPAAAGSSTQIRK